MNALPATREPEVIWAPRDTATANLEDELLRVFRRALDALTAGRAVVVVVREDDILAHGGALDAAAAHAVIGIVRTLAIEGQDNGWRINALSIDADAEIGHSATMLATNTDASGALLRLGVEQLGRLPV
jgi:hypothetical protein